MESLPQNVRQFKYITQTDELKQGDKIIITAPVLKHHFAKEFFLVHRQVDSELWAYSDKKSLDIITGYAGPSQFTLTDNGTGFKSHMIMFGDEDGFMTFCGIDDSASERFYEKAELNEYFDNEDVNCKKCLKGYYDDYQRILEIENE